MFTPNWIEAVVPPHLLKQATQKGIVQKDVSLFKSSCVNYK